MNEKKRVCGVAKSDPEQVLYAGRVVNFIPKKRMGVLAVVSSNGTAVTRRLRIFFYMRDRRDYREAGVEGGVFDEVSDAGRQPIKGEMIFFRVRRKRWRGKKEQYKATPWDFVQDTE